MKKILMLVPLLVLLVGCSKTEEQTTPPADASTATNTAPAQ